MKIEEKNLVILLLEDKIKKLKQKQKEAREAGAILHYTSEYILIVSKSLLKKLKSKK